MDKSQVTTSPHTTRKNLFGHACIRCGRACIYFILCVMAVFLLLFSALSFYLYQNPKDLSKHIAEEVKTRTNVDMSFDSVDVTLFPLPALALSNVVLQYENIKLNVAYATATPSLLGLIKGELAFGKISFLRPHVTGTITSENQEAEKRNEGESENIILDYFQSHTPIIAIPSFLYGCDLNIMHASVKIEFDGMQLMVENLDADVDINFFGGVSTDLNLGSSRLLEKENIVAQLDALQFNVEGLHNDIFDDFALSVKTRLHITDVLENADISFYTLTKPFQERDGDESHILSLIKGIFAIRGNLLWYNNPIPISVGGGLVGKKNSIDFEDVSVQLDQDSLVLNATLDQLFSNSPFLAGRLNLGHLSLTQWFGFARNLPPGLQHTLSDIVGGELEFKITEQGLEVPMVTASTPESVFTGKGGVASWKKVVIFLDLTGQKVSLLNAFPESEGVDVAAPVFSHPPLTPIPGTIEAENMKGPTIDYDINIRVKQLTTWDLVVENASFRCIPAEQGTKINPKNHPKAVLLDFNIGKFYGGKGSAKLILFRNEDNRIGYDITAILRNVRAEGPLTILAGREILGGALSLDVTALSYGKTMGEFLFNKKGEMSMRVDNGFFTSQDKTRTTFTKFTTAGKFTSKPLTRKMTKRRMPETLRYNGQWNAQLQRPDLDIKTNLNGILTLVGRNYTDVELFDIPSVWDINFKQGFMTLKQPMLSEIEGKLSLNTSKSKVSIKDLQGSVIDLGNLNFSGSANLDYAKDFIWQTKIKATSEKVSTLLSKLSADNKSFITETAPQLLKVQAEISSNKTNLNFNDLHVQLDDMIAKGTIKKLVTSLRPIWDVDLKFGLLDLDRILGTDDDKTKTKSTQSKTAINTELSKQWSLAWLRENDIKGKIHVEVLRLYKTHSIDVNIPVSLENGVLKNNPISGIFYGGKTQIIFSGRALGDSLHVQGGLQIENANMSELSQDLKLDTVIGGKGSIWISAQGALNNADTILPLLDGTWRLKITEGFLQNRNKDGSFSGPSTHFNELQDAGPLSNGRLYSKNLIIKGPNLDVKGKGYLDLVQNSLDMHLVASTSGLKDIPVRYHGNLENPERTIDTGAVIIGAIGSLSLGIFDIIGGVFGALFNLFK